MHSTSNRFSYLSSIFPLGLMWFCLWGVPANLLSPWEHVQYQPLPHRLVKNDISCRTKRIYNRGPICTFSFLTLIPWQFLAVTSNSVKPIFAGKDRSCSVAIYRRLSPSSRELIIHSLLTILAQLTLIYIYIYCQRLVYLFSIPIFFF